MKLTDIYTAPAVSANFYEVHSNVMPYLGSGLFPAIKKAGLDISQIKGYKGLPVSLAPSTFDAKSTFRDRIGISKIDMEMAFFRESMLVKEKDEQDIMRCLDSNDPFAQTVLNHIFDDANTLISGANVVPERMIMQLLSPTSGKPGINITANGVPYVYDYDPSNTFQTNNFLALTTTGKWSDTANSDPLTDIKTAQDKVEDSTGSRPTTAIMSRKTFNYLLQNAKIKSGILAQNVTANIFMTDGIMKAFIQEQLGVSIIIYTKKFKTEAGIATSFYPDDMCTLVPDGTIGTTWYGTTPEERTLLGSNNGASVSIVNTGVAVSVKVTDDPVNTKTTVSEIVLPSFERMDECFVIKVA